MYLFQFHRLIDMNLKESESGKKDGSLLKDIRSVLEKARTLGLTNNHVADPEVNEPTFHWNSVRDTRYAHRGYGLDEVLHIFQQQWFGIRAAAGSLPGYKLAVGPEGALDHASKRALARKIQQLKPQRIVVHGMSDAMGDLVEALASIGMSECIFVVIHGAPAQWCSPQEARYAFRAFELGRSRKIRRLHVMKPGFELPDVPIYQPLLFNMSPVLLNDEFGADSLSFSNDATVFIPGWSGWRKNVQTNALAAALCDSVKTILVFDHALILPGSLNKKIKKIKYKNREQTFDLIKLVDAVMNVSIVDCHPMVHIEAQKLGKACMRGPLFLDALEDHPYVKLTEVADVTSVNEIRSRLERLISVPAVERRELSLDYQRQNDHISIGRYQEFLEL